MIYTKHDRVVDRALRSAYFSDLYEVGQAYELESRKPRITIRRPFQIGIAVYQLAKLRMLEFYYDFLDRYFDRKDFELIQVDTDNNYMAISAERLEDMVRPELQTEFEARKQEWLAWASGAAAFLGSSNSNAKVAGGLCSARSVISSRNWKAKKRSSARRGCRRSRMRSRGSVSSQRWKAVRTWQRTLVFA